MGIPAARQTPAMLYPQMRAESESNQSFIWNAYKCLTLQ